MSDVIVVIGPGQIGQAIARRVGVGKQIVLADLRLDTATAAAAVLLPVDERRSLRAWIVSLDSQILRVGGRYAEAVTRAHEALALIRPDELVPRGFVIMGLALALHMGGELAAAVEPYREALRLLDADDLHPRDTSRTCSACGHCEKANRRSQAEFSCVVCGHTASAAGRTPTRCTTRCWRGHSRRPARPASSFSRRFIDKLRCKCYAWRHGGS